MIRALDQGYQLDYLGYTAIMRGCDHQGLNEVWTGVVRMNAQGRPITAEVEITNGKEVVKSCDEVMQLRAAAQKRKP